MAMGESGVGAVAPSEAAEKGDGAGRSNDNNGNSGDERSNSVSRPESQEGASKRSSPRPGW